MGANDDDKPERKKRGPKEPLTSKQKEHLLEAGNAIDDGLVSMVEAGQISREFSLARTRLEEAEMWLERGFEAMGYDLGGDDEEEAEDEDDEGDDKDDGDKDEAAD